MNHPRRDSEGGITLNWPGKRLRVEPSRPAAQTLEQTRPNAGAAAQEPADRSGLLLYGDNFDALSWMLANGYRGRVRLAYLDPPYNSNRAYVSRIRLRGKGQPVLGAQTAYADIWQAGGYLQFMADRLLLLRDLLHADGTLWLHCDHRMQARLLLLLEEIFGPNCYLNTVFWRSQTMRGAKAHARYFPRSAHAIHIFRAQPQGRPVWQAPTRELVLTEAEAASKYMRDERGFFRTSDPGSYSFERLTALCAEGRLYAPYGGRVVVDEQARRVYASNGGNIGVKYYLARRGPDSYAATRAVDNLWDDIAGLGTVPAEDENYPTQKTERLLRRILETATRPGDLVLDPFVGSGTAVAVAAKLGRDWIGCDNGWRAVRTASGRLGRIAQEPRAPGSGDGYRILRIGEASPLPAPGAARSTAEGQTAARIDVRLDWEGDRLSLRIERFFSPALARLAAAADLPLPEEWRAQARALLIDPDYDGAILRPALVDAPAGRRELVAGVYALPQPEPAARRRTAAVLIVDAAGEEHLILIPAARPADSERPRRAPSRA